MEDHIGHNCGVTFIFLRKPIEYYPKYFSLTKQRVMLLKSRNRGQDSAGIATVDERFEKEEEDTLHVDVALGPDPVNNLFRNYINKDNHDGRLSIGHNRYSTSGKSDLKGAHPKKRHHERPTKRIAIASNGNFTNLKEQKKKNREQGYSITSKYDTDILLNHFAYSLKKEHDELFKLGKNQEDINKELNLVNIISQVQKELDGGYVITGILANGDGFVFLDPNGIKPFCYYIDDDMIVGASESLPITSAFGIHPNKIKYLKPAEVLVVKNNGDGFIKEYTIPAGFTPCMFEYVYFARANSWIWDQEVKTVRDKLAIPLAKRIFDHIKKIDENYKVIPIPNTALAASLKVARELEKSSGIDNLFDIGLIKDEAARLFITKEEEREEMTFNAFDGIYSVLENIIGITVDDSKVRGTTSEKKILPVLFESGLKEVYETYTCPQLRHPCCYGIDMSRYSEFIAFRATIKILKDKGLENKIQDAYEKAKKQLEFDNKVNIVNELYSLVNEEEINNKIVEMSAPKGINSKNIYNIYQSVNGLVESIGFGNNLCTACLTGNYPTKGGTKIANQSFVDFIEDRKERSYDH